MSIFLLPVITEEEKDPKTNRITGTRNESFQRFDLAIKHGQQPAVGRYQVGLCCRFWSNGPSAPSGRRPTPPAPPLLPPPILLLPHY
ncbi:hypothetical protein BLOT_015462 [Blomia tropicalis]|nr:hypothetical protein BLOT_015462 [Blomia tropicalis]